MDKIVLQKEEYRITVEELLKALKIKMSSNGFISFKTYGRTEVLNIPNNSSFYIFIERPVST